MGVTVRNETGTGGLKEENLLFTFADHLVTGSARGKLCRDYGAVCQRSFEGRTKKELDAPASRLLGEYGRG